MPDNNKQLKIFCISWDLDYQMYKTLVMHHVNTSFYKSRIHLNSIKKVLECKRLQQCTLGQLLRQTEKPPTNDVVLLRLSIRKSILFGYQSSQKYALLKDGKAKQIKKP